MKRRGTLFWVGLAVVLITLGYLFGRPPEEGDPLDPDGTGDLGTKALMLLLEEYGVGVSRIGLPEPEVDFALVLADRFDLGQREALEEWVADGGTLVVADPGSGFAPAPGPPILVDGTSLGAGSCTIPELQDLTIDAGSFRPYPIAEADGHCFGGDDDAGFVHLDVRGDGRVISLGTALVLTNTYLDQADNAALAARLLVPPGAEVEGGATVAVFYEPIITPESRDLVDLLSSGVRWAGVQLAVAFVLFTWLQARRFGRPVDEPQPVELPGSLLVRATGELLRRSRSHEQASIVLRHHAQHRIRRRMAAAADTPVEQLVEEVVARAEVERPTVELALVGPLAHDGKSLAALVAAIDATTASLAEATDDRAPTTGART